MEKEAESSLFINDGSFMERFKLLQPEEKGQRGSDDLRESKIGTLTPAFSSSHVGILKGKNEVKMTEKKKLTLSASTGKLAFSLKQKPKIVTPAVKLGEEDDEEEDCGNSSDDGQMKRQKLMHSSDSDSSRQRDDAPPPPSDPAVKKVADKLASFVTKNGRQFEHITRQRNPGDTPFKFLFDEKCPDYKYYEHRLIEEEKALGHNGALQASCSSDASTLVSRTIGSAQKPMQYQSNYQMPTSALYENVEDASFSGDAAHGESSGASKKDPIAMMEFYMNKAAQEERMRQQPKQSKDEMPPPPSLQGGPGKKGHHMGDYIPQDELEKFMATCNDAAALKAAREACERGRILSDNVGHKLLSKMGWKEGEGLGSAGRGIADPIVAGDVKKNNLGVGAHNPGEVTPDDDIYEQYKKRMMLGYRYRPNPLNNPRKAYY